MMVAKLVAGVVGHSNRAIQIHKILDRLLMKSSSLFAQGEKES